MNASFFNWKALAASVATLIGMEKISAHNTDDTKAVVITEGKVKDDISAKRGKETRDTIAPAPGKILKGQVIDKLSGEPILFAVIKIKDANKTFTTDEQGCFTIKDEPSGSDTLTFSYLGYKTLSIPLSTLMNAAWDGKIRLEEQLLMWSGDIAITRVSKTDRAFHRFGNLIKSAFSKKDKE